VTGAGSPSGTGSFSQGGTGRLGHWPRRGPKGYQRSDERIREDICERLIRSEHIDSSEVTIEVSGGNVTLEGTVPDRRMKHAIEDMAEATFGVNDVENRVRVARGEAGGHERGGDTSGGRESIRTAPVSAAGPGGAASPSGSASGEAGNAETASRGPGSSSGLAGQSMSSSSTAKAPRD
jgi:hypothetical protein